MGSLLVRPCVLASETLLLMHILDCGVHPWDSRPAYPVPFLLVQNHLGRMSALVVVVIFVMLTVVAIGAAVFVVVVIQVVVEIEH